METGQNSVILRVSVYHDVKVKKARSMEEISPADELKKMKSQLSRLKLEAKLRRNLASEIEKQKQIALAAQSAASARSRRLTLR